MNIRFDVIRQSDETKRAVWTFVTIDNAVVVDAYKLEERAVRRKAYRVTSAYARLLHDYPREAETRLSETDVPLPADVLAEAQQTFLSRVRFGMWTQNGGAK